MIWFREKRIPTCLHGRFGLGKMKKRHPPLIILLGYGLGPENDVFGLILQFFLRRQVHGASFIYTLLL